MCLQINIDAEPQKQGIRAQDAPALALAALRCENIVLRGLMCLPATNHMPAPSDQMPSRATRNAFEQLAELLDTLRNSLTDIPSHSSHFTPRRSPQTLDTLSMGMSADLPQAIAAGSTLVRVGTALFGPRLNTQNAKPHSMNPDDSAPPLDTGPDTH